MTQPIRTADIARWLDLIALAIRLTNPKVSDLSPLKKAAQIVNRARLPEEFQGIHDNPFVRLIKAAKTLERNRELERELLITIGWLCLEKLLGLDIGPKGRDGLRREALRNFETFRAVLAGLCKPSDSDAS